MFKLSKNIYIGKKADLQNAINSNYNVIVISTWSKILENTDSEIALKDKNKFLNSQKCKRAIIEIENEEIPHYKVAEFNRILELINDYQKDKELIILSEHAQSRAPSFGLLWMAFKSKQISNSSFAAARLDFSQYFLNYIPWPGMIIFLNQEWDSLNVNNSLSTKAGML